MESADQDVVRSAYGDAKYARRAGIQATYDPDNGFRPITDILPAR